MKKKIGMIIVAMVLVLVVVGILTNYADGGRVTTNHEPKYCIRFIDEEEHKVTYIGLGYKVVRFFEESADEPYEENIGVKMGSWFMKYELPIDSKYRKDGNKSIETLNDFYNTEVTKGNDIRLLSKNYTILDASKDNVFTLGNFETYNQNFYKEFMEKYKNKESAFIRVAQSTVEGDLVLYDVLYYEKTDKVYLVTDNTRDKFGKEEELEVKEYEGTELYEEDNRLYWVLYNVEVNEDTFRFNSEDVFLIASIK